MRVLFVISVMALITLLWVSIATAQYVRRARRRRRRALESLEPESTRGTLGLTPRSSAPELRFLDPNAPVAVPAPEPESEPIAIVPLGQAIDETDSATTELEPEIVKPTILEDAEPELTLAAEGHLEEVQHEAPPPAPGPQPAIDPTPEPEISEAAEVQLEAEQAKEDQPEFHTQPDNIHIDIPADTPAEAQTETEAEPPPPPPPPRIFRSGPPKHPLAQLVQPLHRPDWAYFNKDMGDLSDPVARGGSRIDSRIRPAYKPPVNPEDPNVK